MLEMGNHVFLQITQLSTYRGLPFIPDIDLHWFVIAALSDCDGNHHLWTAARFIEMPVKPPFVIESWLTVSRWFDRTPLQRNRDYFVIELRN